MGGREGGHTMRCAICDESFWAGDRTNLTGPTSLAGRNACETCGPRFQDLLAGQLSQSGYVRLVALAQRGRDPVVISELERLGSGFPDNPQEDAPVDEPSTDITEPRARRARTYAMVDALAEARKYRIALEGDRLAYFSIIGTESWEDYASLSFAAMRTETLVDIDIRLDSLTEMMTRVDANLERIALLLEAGLANPPQRG